MPGNMKEGTANWGVKESPDDLRTCCQNGSKLGVDCSDAEMKENALICDPTSGDTFDPA